MAEKGKEKVTMMKLKVDLDCAKCYKRVKKVLCKFPQIRDQFFDEKSNMVIIKVVCCSPEWIMDKLCSKGGGAIKTIEIIEPPKPPSQPQPPPQKPKAPEKPKEPEKPKQPEKPKEPEKPKQPEKPKEPEKPKQPEKPKEPEKLAARQPCNGCRCGPACNGCGMPPQPYECYGRPVYNSWGGGCPCTCTCPCPCPCPCPPPSYRHCHVIRCDYFSEENPQSCSIM